MSKKYYWNFNDHAELWYSYDDNIKDCIVQAREEVDEYKAEEGIEEEIQSVFIGELKEFKPSVCVDRVLDFIVDDAYDEVGELAEGFLDGVSNDVELELEEDLNKVLNKWLDKHKLSPCFGAIEDVKEYDLETGDEVKQ